MLARAKHIADFYIIIESMIYDKTTQDDKDEKRFIDFKRDQVPCFVQSYLPTLLPQASGQL